MDVDGKMQIINIQNPFITECDVSYCESGGQLLVDSLPCSKKARSVCLQYGERLSTTHSSLSEVKGTLT